MMSERKERKGKTTRRKNLPLLEGSFVKILRSNGSTCEACVKKISTRLASVDVEWCENGETKGKEVSMHMILSLNTQYRAPEDEELMTANTRSETVVIQHENTPDFDKMDDNIVTKDIKPCVSLEDITLLAGPSGLQKEEQKPPYKIIPSLSSGNMNKSQIPVSEKLSRKSFLPRPMSSILPKSTTSIPTKSTQSILTGRTSLAVTKASQAKKVEEDTRRFKVPELERKTIGTAAKNTAAAYVPNKKAIEPQNHRKIIQEYLKNVHYQCLTVNDPVISEQINVCVRKRPLNKKELTNNDIDVVTVVTKNSLIMHDVKTRVDLEKYVDHLTFTFDYVFNETCSNEMVAMYTVKPLVDHIFQNGMATCFAYGQTGSGKTYTMGGVMKPQETNHGIYTYVTQQVFQKIDKLSGKSVLMSFFEIYCGRVFDLLNSKNRLRVLEDWNNQVNVCNLSMKPVCKIEDVIDLIKSGSSLRTTGKTLLNTKSSRSHAIFQLILIGEKKNVLGKISLVDLAGNERGSDTIDDRKSRVECAEINTSLLALKECIRSLGRDASHVPFRACTLTKVLRDSFIGKNSKMCMIATISPSIKYSEYTLNTLRYAERVKDIPNAAIKSNLQPIEEQYNVDLSEHIEEALSLNNSDLMVVQKENEDSMSSEMIPFNEALNDYLEAEERMMVRLDEANGRLRNIITISEQILTGTDISEELVESYETELSSINAYTSKVKNSIIEFRSKLRTYKLFEK